MGKLASDFQTEIYAIIQCAYENIRRAYKNKRILVFSDSQAALTAVSSPKVTSKLVAECQDSLLALANRNEITLIWVPWHHGNEEAGQASAAQPLRPQRALGIPNCLVREAIKNWTELQHFNKRTQMPDCKHGKLFIGRPCKKRAKTAKTEQAPTKIGSSDHYWACCSKRSPAYLWPV